MRGEERRVPAARVALVTGRKSAFARFPHTHIKLLRPVPVLVQGGEGSGRVLAACIISEWVTGTSIGCEGLGWMSGWVSPLPASFLGHFSPLSKLHSTGGDVEHGGVKLLAAEGGALGVPALLQHLVHLLQRGHRLPSGLG